MFGLTSEIYEALTTVHNIPSFYYQKQEGTAIYTEETSNFGEVGFKAICNEKPFLVVEILKLGFNALWTDSDILFFLASYIPNNF